MHPDVSFSGQRTRQARQVTDDHIHQPSGASVNANGPLLLKLESFAFCVQERHAQGIHQPLMMDPRPGLHAGGVSSLVSIQEAMSLPLNLPPQHLYTCTIGRKRSQAR